MTTRHSMLSDSLDLIVAHDSARQEYLRRNALKRVACGVGGMALAALASSTASAAPAMLSTLMPRAKRIIFLFMQGGVSQVDSFDYKPALQAKDGQRLTVNDARQLAKTGKPTEQRLMKSPWQFRQFGETGRWVSDLFPHTAQHVDSLTMLHAMHTEGVAHGPATLFLHCGATNSIRPSFGSWVLYGLGSENENLPGFVSIAPSIGNGGPRNYGSAFLPPQYQGTRVGAIGKDALTIEHLDPSDWPIDDRLKHKELLQGLNQAQLDRRQGPSAELLAANGSVEMAWRMQCVAPEILDLQRESSDTLKMYGIDQPKTRGYGQRCLLARRLCEAGVRFVQVNYGDNSANPAWDQHSNLPKHKEHAEAVDQPIAALLTDLQQRGLLEDTIVWWGGEFGRTPYAEANGTGRDHNPGGFTVWLAGGGFKPGYTHGESDEIGFQGVAGKVHIHDLHATLLHQLGLDHEALTYRHAGRDFRLTDVYGRVVRDILA